MPEVWASYQKQWKDSKGHKTILTRLTWTPEVLAKANAAFDFEPFARNQKLDQLVDQELAARDQTFRTALEHWNASARQVGHGMQHSSPVTEQQYMNAQRAAWWRAQESKLNVTLNDPTLAQKCGLATK